MAREVPSVTWSKGDEFAARRGMVLRFLRHPEETKDPGRLVLDLLVPAYYDVRRYGVRGGAQPPPEYVLARAAFVDLLVALRARGVPTADIARALGISRSAVSQWVRRGSGDAQRSDQ